MKERSCGIAMTMMCRTAEPALLQRLREPLDRRLLGPLRVADGEEVFPEDEDVASFDVGAHPRVGDILAPGGPELVEPEDPVGPGEARVVLEDRPGDEGLAQSCRRRHRATDEAVADRDDRVALEEVVRDGRHQEEGVDRAGDLRVGLFEPLNEGCSELLGVEVGESLDDRGRQPEGRGEPSRTCLRRSGSTRTSSRRSCTSRTSEKRRRTCWNRRCSSRARAPCRMSSKRRSCIMLGVIRSISRPGWWMTTDLRRPISEWTAIGMVEPPWQPRENNKRRRR